jgi:hypothetical protein
MDYTLIILVIGAISKFITDYLKKLPWFNLVNQESTKGRKQTTAFVVVAVVTLVLAFFTGNLDVINVQNTLVLIVNILLGGGVAIATHEVTSE